MKAAQALEQARLGYKLVPVTIRQLLYLSSTPCDFYIQENGLFVELLRKNTYIDNDVIRELIQNNQIHLFIYADDKKELIAVQQENLRQVTRSLSIGDALEKGKKQTNLLAINMGYLYEFPMEDDLLQLQYQSVVNLFRFLFENTSIHEQLYLDFKKYKHHYIFSQPFLSSLFLLGVLKMSHVYSEKELENLFVTSYFKDIGMSAVPIEKYSEKELSEHDKKLLSRHADISVNILQGRLPISPNHLKIIEGHHAFSLLSDDLSEVKKENSLVITGTETVMVACMDIISAMISERPYRGATSLFEALEMIKILISDSYPNEFRLIVTYFKNFFAKTMRK